ncbi:hypothetical protein MASR2M117_21520 [Paludibacter sp.]
MNALDLYILVPILLGFVVGLFRGLIKEIVSLVVIILGIYISKLFSSFVAKWLNGHFDISLKLAQPLAFIIIFAIVAILLILASKFLQGIIKNLSLGFINSILGGLFGALKFALLVSVILIVFDTLNDRFSFIDKESKDKSILFQPVKKIAPNLWQEVTEKKS